MTTKEDMLRPIIGIENRTPQEAFDIMCDRIRRSIPAPSAAEATGGGVAGDPRDAAARNIVGAAERYLSAVAALGQQSGYNKLSYFETPILKAPTDEIGDECFKRWFELDAAGKNLRAAIAAAKTVSVEATGGGVVDAHDIASSVAVAVAGLPFIRALACGADEHQDFFGQVQMATLPVVQAALSAAPEPPAPVPPAGLVDLIAKLRAGLKGLPPGPWEVDGVRQDDAPDRHLEYELLDARGYRLCDTQNSDYRFGEIEVEHDEDGSSAWNEPARKLMEHIARCDPATIGALLDALAAPVRPAQGWLEQHINLLTDGEGDAVTFCSPNQDLNGLPNECVVVSASWTGWTDREFRADTREECLRLAVAAMRDEARISAAIEPAPAGGGE